MSTTRRNFILGTAAGLILPSYYDKVFTFFENHGEPLIEIPKAFDKNLCAVDWGGGIIEFHLGEVATESPGPMAKAYFLNTGIRVSMVEVS
jgi:hypothetical protein